MKLLESWATKQAWGTDVFVTVQCQCSAKCQTITVDVAAALGAVHVTDYGREGD